MSHAVPRLFLLFATVAAAQTALVLAAEDSARIFVYADWDSPQKSYVPVYFDGVLIAEIKRGRFFAINVLPGQHILIAGEGVPEPVNAKQGKEFFVRLEQDVELSASGKTAMLALSVKTTAQGKTEIGHLVYLDSGKIYSKLVSRGDPSLLEQPTLQKRE